MNIHNWNFVFVIVDGSFAFAITSGGFALAIANGGGGFMIASGGFPFAIIAGRIHYWTVCCLEAPPRPLQHQTALRHCPKSHTISQLPHTSEAAWGEPFRRLVPYAWWGTRVDASWSTTDDLLQCQMIDERRPPLTLDCWWQREARQLTTNNLLRLHNTKTSTTSWPPLT